MEILTHGYIKAPLRNWVDDGIPLRCPNVQDAIVTTRILYIFFGSGFPTKTFATIAGMGDNPRYENKHVEH